MPPLMRPVACKNYLALLLCAECKLMTVISPIDPCAVWEKCPRRTNTKWTAAGGTLAEHDAFLDPQTENGYMHIDIKEESQVLANDSNASGRR